RELIAVSNRILYSADKIQLYRNSIAASSPWLPVPRRNRPMHAHGVKPCIVTARSTIRRLVRLRRAHSGCSIAFAFLNSQSCVCLGRLSARAGGTQSDL